VEPTRYLITVQGCMSERLRPAFDGLDIEPDNVQITLVGKIRDEESAS